MHVGGFFSARLKQHQVNWLPCEIKALAISASINHWSPYILESTNTVQILSDSWPCVQAYDRLCRGQFSSSAHVSTFLSALSRYKVSLQHGVQFACDILCRAQQRILLIRDCFCSFTATRLIPNEQAISLRAAIIMSTPLGGGHIIFAFFRRPASVVRHLPSVKLGFRSFQGKVFILCLPNLVWVFIGSTACMGLLLVKIALSLTE